MDYAFVPAIPDDHYRNLRGLFARMNKPIRIMKILRGDPLEVTTATLHGFRDNQRIIVQGVQDNPAANGEFNITRTGPLSFTLNGSSGAATSGEGGDARLTSLPISAVGLQDNRILVTTAFPHGLMKGQDVTIKGVSGTTNANGEHFVEPTEQNQFLLESGVFYNGTYEGGGACFPHAVSLFPKVNPTTGNSISKPYLETLTSIVDALSDPTFARPIRHIHIGMHAGNEAGTAWQIFPGQRLGQKIDDYEALKETLKPDTQNSIRIPDSVIGEFQKVDAAAHIFNMTGCALGQGPQEFLSKWKEALGGHFTLRAPKQLHMVAPNNAYDFNAQEGAWECLVCIISAISPNGKPCNSQAQVISLLRGKAQQNGLSDEVLRKWIPKKARYLRPGEVFHPDKGLTLALGTAAGPTTKTLPFAEHFLFRVYTETYQYDHLLEDGKAGPKTVEGGLSLIREVLTKLPPFLDDPNQNGLPYWQRLGLSSLDAFLAAHVWANNKEYTDKDGARRWLITGTRVLYEIWYPLTTTVPTDGVLANRIVAANFFPNPDLGLRPVLNLPEDQFVKI